MLYSTCHFSMSDQSQAQQGLLSPLIMLSPFPQLWFRQIVNRDSENLVNPFMRVFNQKTRHLATFIYFTDLNRLRHLFLKLQVIDTFTMQVFQYLSWLPMGLARSLSRLFFFLIPFFKVHRPLTARYDGLSIVTHRRLATRLTYLIGLPRTRWSRRQTPAYFCLVDQQA